MPDDSLTRIKGEKKKLKFTVTDSDGNTVDVSSTTCTLYAYNESGQAFTQIEDGSFDKTEASSGILYATVTFGTSGDFTMVLKIAFTGGGQLIHMQSYALKVKDLDVPS